MEILLHEGHEHADSAATTGVSVEMMVLIALGVLVLAVVASYTLKRYSQS